MEALQSFIEQIKAAISDGKLMKKSFNFFIPR